jgi:hypothetical protein
METKNYSIFKYFTDNRGNCGKALDNGLVIRLMHSIQKVGYIKSRPILVDQNNFIIDGQHRLEACKRLGISAIYEEQTTEDHKSIMLALNRTQLIWRLEDFINSFANQGMSEYIYLRNIEDKYHLGWSNTIRVVGGNKLRAKCIREGQSFLPNPETENIANFILSMKELYFYISIHFVCAIIAMWRSTTNSQRLRIYKNRMSIPQSPSQATYLTIFENIINKGVHEQNRVKLNSK